MPHHELKWHAPILLFPLNDTGVPRLVAQVARLIVGVPRLGLQVARHSEMLGLACHAFDTKWHAQSLLLLSLCISVPCLVAQVARLSEVESVPRHGAQVARPCICALFMHLCTSWSWRDAFDTKWYAIVEVLLEMVSWRAMPLCSSGTPIVVDGSGVPCPTWHVTPLLCPPFYSGILY
ncbi:hypothetical protein AHAS_Ahas09G0153000 [Arachis hypogaea]